MEWGSQMYILMFITNEKNKIFIGLKLSLVHLDFWRMNKNVKYFYNNTMLLEIIHILRSF